MRIILNNREEEVVAKDQMTVEELLSYKNFTFKFLVVKVNGKLIHKADYHSTHIVDGDEVVVLHLISGG